MMANEEKLSFLSRRNFVKASAFILPTLHLFMESCAETKLTSSNSEVINKILRIELLVNSDKIKNQKEFYVKKLNLPLIAENELGFEIMVGKTIIEFIINDEVKNPIYHIAFNIPENKLGKAKLWSEKRFELLKNDYGEEVIHFRKWNAHAIYYKDPAQNILEFIAHHSLRNGQLGDFTDKDILFVGEIALVSNDVQKLSKEINEKLGMEDFISADKVLNSSKFRAIGDPNGMIILSKSDREWLMTDVPAKDFKVNIELRSDKNEIVSLNNNSCNVKMISSKH